MDRHSVNVTIIPSVGGRGTFYVKVHTAKFDSNLRVEYERDLLDTEFYEVEEDDAETDLGGWAMGLVDLVVQALEELYSPGPLITRRANGQDTSASQTPSPKM